MLLYWWCRGAKRLKLLELGHFCQDQQLRYWNRWQETKWGIRYCRDEWTTKMAKENLFFHIEKRCFGQYSYSLQEEEWKYMDGWQIWHRTKIFDCEYEDTYMTMTMNIHLTMTVNILLTIMWMRTKTTGAVERHPEEWVFPLWIRCSSVVSPPRPEPASLSGTLQCWRSFEAQSPSLFWKQKRFTPVFNGIVEVPVSSPRAVHSLLADLDVCTAAKTFILNCVYDILYPSPRVL